jgi:hypothetical protein
VGTALRAFAHPTKKICTVFTRVRHSGACASANPESRLTMQSVNPGSIPDKKGDLYISTIDETVLFMDR